MACPGFTSCDHATAIHSRWSSGSEKVEPGGMVDSVGKAVGS
jgi:hypothetical protein